MIGNSPARRAVHDLFSRLNSSRLWKHARWLYRLSVLLNPQPVFLVRGVAIRVALPLGQLGVFDTAKNWELREPETLDWIDGMGPSDIFVDVGASFGTETLYAALKSGGPGRIYAFDGDLLPSHYLALNLRLNRIMHVSLYFLPLGRGSQPIEFTCPSNVFLSGQHHLAAPENSISYHLWSQALDDFCEVSRVFPTHVKIDVDGRELSVLEGMSRTLADPALRSLLVEVRQDTMDRVVAWLDRFGFHTPSPLVLTGESTNLSFHRH